MLEYEDENRKFLADRFDPQLDCTRRLLATAHELRNSLHEHFQEHSDAFDPQTAIVISVLFDQLLRRCRAGILVWESAYPAETEVLARSLFDSHLAARFVIETQLPQPHRTPHLRGEFNLLCDLSGEGISRFTDINFRAMLYAACQTLKLDNKADAFKALPGLRGVLPVDFGEQMRLNAADAESVIGFKWAERIRKIGTFHGFSQIKLLAEYCGADKSHYYQTLYGIQSGSTHGEAALLLMKNRTCLPPPFRRRHWC